MAPPIPGLRAPAPVHRRTVVDVLLGVLAVLSLAALTVGVPVGLALFVGLPAPHSLSLSVLTSRLDLTTILKILSLIVWLAWIQLVWCVLAEIRAAVRNVGVPGRVPLAGATQSLAHRLVTAALLLFSATAALSPALAHSAAPPRPVHSISVQARPPVHQVPDGPAHSEANGAAYSEATGAAHSEATGAAQGQRQDTVTPARSEQRSQAVAAAPAAGHQ